MDAETTAGLTRHFSTWIPEDSKAANPTYVALVDAVLSSDELLELAAMVPRPQFPANVLFATVHDLLLGGTEHPLSSAYASVSSMRGLPITEHSPTEIGELFSDFVKTNRAAIEPKLLVRLTQTNEVQRCGVLAIGLMAAVADDIRPIALIDVGCSAGLNLHLDRFSITLGDHTLGDENASVRIRTRIDGPSPDGPLPTIAQRIGIDQNPLDPRDQSDARWLQACLWPDDVERFTRLGAALATASHHGDATLLRGDFLEATPRALAMVEPGHHPLVMSSWAVAYLPREDHARFINLLETLGRAQPFTYVAMEPAERLGELGLLDEATALGLPGATCLVVTRSEAGNLTSTLLGTSHPHGGWFAGVA